MSLIRLLVLFLIFVSLSIASKAQLSYSEPSGRERDAGFQLRIAARHFKTGVIISVSGSLVTVIGDVSVATGHGGSGFVLIGALATITGLCFIVESYSHIGKAGEILSGKSKFSLGLTPSGFGLVYKL